jgi:DNA-binding winged helix-turn-helix (wHTH) protein
LGADSLAPADPAPATVSPEIWFGPFCLRVEQRVLLEAGRPVRIGGRGLDLLVALVERAGELVTKQDLIARVWPNVSVGEVDNLKTQIVFEPRWGTVATAPTTW